MRSSLGAQVPVQPDGGEGQVKREGGVVRRDLKGACSEAMTLRTETRYEA